MEAREIRSGARWMILNQSQSPLFQALQSELSSSFGPCVVYTGTPHPGDVEPLRLVAAPAYDRRSVLRRGLSWGAFLAGAARRVLFEGRGLPVFVTTNPPFLLHLAWAAHRLFGAPYALLVWDLYPDHLVKMGWAGERNPLTRAWRALNGLSFRDASAVITIGTDLARAIQRQLPGGAARHIFLIPNWADTDRTVPLEKDQNPFAREHDLVGKLTVMYSGNIGATHGVDAIARIAEQLAADPRITFVVIGDGLGREALRREIEDRKLNNVKLLPYLSWGQVRFSLAAADIALVTQLPGTEHLSVPSKAYPCLAAGNAILALTSPQSDLGRLVGENGVGVVVPPSDVAAAVSAIRSLAGDPARLAALRSSARRLAEVEFNPRVARARFEEALRALFSRD
jgi:glycosyltransferase involved in cell wall biosynthesis